MKQEWICLENRTGKSIDDLPEIADSGLILYELKMQLNSCKTCDDYTTIKGEPYCLQYKVEK